VLTCALYTTEVLCRTNCRQECMRNAYDIGGNEYPQRKLSLCISRLGSIDDPEQYWKRAVTKVQATKALKGGALEELEEEDDGAPQPVLEMDFSVVDMGMHFVEVDQTPLEEDQVSTLAASHVPWIGAMAELRPN